MLLQSLNYWIITIERLPKHIKLDMLDNIDKYILNQIDVVYKEDIKNRNRDNVLPIDDALLIFTELLKKRNEFGEYISILNELENEQIREFELFYTVEDRYKVSKNTYEIDNKRIKYILTEGINVDGYNQKLEESKEVIDSFSLFGGRKVSRLDLFDLKVYFRELFVSDSKYKKQARTIVRQYLKRYRETNDIKSFRKESEYMFIREKISRGCFRETGNLDLYNKKNIIQKNVYQLILLMYLTYDYEYTIKLIYTFTFELITGLYDMVFEQIYLSKNF
ncbi:hypothetical protein NYR90_05470 [Clostridioides difficile]|nr:hypothetical protein NYR90_05470 [Clostridioides difficile]